MKLNIDMTGKEVRVTKLPEPKTDNASGQQRTDKATGQKLWATQVVVQDETGGEVIHVTTSGTAPQVRVGDVVRLAGLVAIPWVTNGRNGVAFRADQILTQAHSQ